MDPTQIRRYMAVARRQLRLILQAMVIVGAISYVLTAREPSNPFQASATVIVSASNEADKASMVAVARSREVADLVALKVPGTDPNALRSAIQISQAPQSNIVTLVSRHPSPETAVRTVNAYADAFVQNRLDNEREAKQDAAAALDKTLTDLKGQIATLQTQVDAVGGTTKAPSTLTAALVVANTEYQEKFRQQSQLITDAASTKGPVEVLEKAESAFQPPVPDPVKRGVLGAGIGLILGIGLAVLREMFDDRLRTKADLERISPVTVLAELPFDEGAAKRNSLLPSVERPASPLAEGLRSLRTSVTFLGMDRPIRRIVVTSPSPGDGKTLMAANLACTYAQAGFKTILVSCDLRRPSLEPHFHVPPHARGFAEMMVTPAIPPINLNGNYGYENGAGNGNGHSNGNGAAVPAAVGAGGVPGQPLAPPDLARMVEQQRVTIDSVLIPTHVPNLTILPAGTLPPNPGELLATRRASEVIEEVAARAEIVVIDTPPTIVTDAALLAGIADGVILVTASGQTHGESVKRAFEMLSGGHIRVLGVVLNKVKRREAGTYSTYTTYAPRPLNGSRKGK